MKKYSFPCRIRAAEDSPEADVLFLDVFLNFGRFHVLKTVQMKLQGFCSALCGCSITVDHPKHSEKPSYKNLSQQQEEADGSRCHMNKNSL